ncbi:cytochrome P450 [Poronia punctata]|nr:cytochrome P450 [Poronia punctata]
MSLAKAITTLSSLLDGPGLITRLGVAVLVGSLSSCLVVGVYRLYFHPLSKFPGDKLAAATGWVETYHDVFRGGQFIFKLGEWHEKYGPIVRISPWEVHIADPDFVDVLYSSNSRFDKKIEWKYRFGIPHSTFDTIEHQHHRLRRSALAPFFSKQKIGLVTEFISSKVQRLCDRLEEKYKASGQPVLIHECFTALSFDVITYYSFARSFEYIELPDFQGPFTSAFKQLASTLHTMGHFPWLLTALQSLPKSISIALNPQLAHVFEFHATIEDQINAIKRGDNDAYKDVAHKTVFNELLNSDLPPEEKDTERVKQEGTFAQPSFNRPRYLSIRLPNRLSKLTHARTTHAAASIVGGGVETTATALAQATYYILENPRVKDKLVDELKSVFPDARETPTLATLETLPYFSCVVTEALRITTGIASRMMRKSRDGPVAYGDYLIPDGYYFSMTTYHTHRDTAVWEAPDEFRPERWQGSSSPVALNGEPLAKYHVGFGRGPRMCLGLNLARAELFIGLAVLFRRCDLELFESTREAVDMKAEYVIPVPSLKSKGVQVLVK